MRVTKINFSGGYHNSPEIEIRVKAFPEEVDGKMDTGELHDLLSHYQIKKLERHFCGIPGCSCGSWRRAEAKISS